MIKALRTVGRYFMLMGRTFSRPERMRMFFRQYLNELEQLGVNSIGIVLLISFFIGAVITIQIKLNIESPWMPRWTVGYVTREIMLLEFSSSIMVTVIPILVTFSIFAGIIGAFCTCWFAGVMNAVDLEYGLQYMFNEWFIWAGIIKSLFFAFIIASVSAFFGYTVEGGSIAVGKASTDSVVSSSVLILFADLILTKLLMG